MAQKVKKKTFELPKEFVTNWLSALKSGDYEQGEGKLAHDNDNDGLSYCCLGVGTIIAGCDINEILDQELPEALDPSIIDIGFPQELYDEAYTWKEVPSESNLPEKVSLISCLTSMNDGLTYNYYEKLIKAFPNLIFRKVPEKFTDSSEPGVPKKAHPSLYYSFEDIAQWIEDNVELV